jgi:SAM-dependent methyltransferase
MQGNAMAWYETFFEQYYLQGFAVFTTPEMTQRQVDFMVKTLRLPPHSRILDLGCGAGRHSLALGERGFQVVGYDLSETLLTVARQAADTRWFPIEFVQGDMRSLPYDTEFDAVVNYFTSFGYFDDLDNARVVQQVARALKPEGKFLLDINNRDATLQNLITRRWWPGDEGVLLLEEIHYEPRRSRFTTEWTLVQADGSRYVFPRMQFRAYALHELVTLCTEAGLTVIDVYGNEHGDSFHPVLSPRIIILAQKQVMPELFT